MEFSEDDRIKHITRGEGTFLKYGPIKDFAIVKFDDYNTKMTVGTKLLEKIKKSVK